MTKEQLKTQIDTDITNKTTGKSISPPNVGNNMKDVVDYVDQEVLLREILSNKSTDGTLASNSDIKYPSEKAVKTYVDANSGSIIKISKQVSADDSNPPEIKNIDYIRCYTNGSDNGIKLTGPHAIGREYYIKNTTAFPIVLIGDVENINGNSSLNIAAGTYWHLIKEDGSTNSITAFKLSLT